MARAERALDAAATGRALFDPARERHQAVKRRELQTAERPPSFSPRVATPAGTASTPRSLRGRTLPSEGYKLRLLQLKYVLKRDSANVRSDEAKPRMDLLFDSSVRPSGYRSP